MPGYVYQIQHVLKRLGSVILKFSEKRFEKRLLLNVF